jgi:hypothetical protein
LATSRPNSQKTSTRPEATSAGNLGATRGGGALGHRYAVALA